VRPVSCSGAVGLATGVAVEVGVSVLVGTGVAVEVGVSVLAGTGVAVEVGVVAEVRGAVRACVAPSLGVWVNVASIVAVGVGVTLPGELSQYTELMARFVTDEHTVFVPFGETS
jgi:hypothetical protein